MRIITTILIIFGLLFSNHAVYAQSVTAQQSLITPPYGQGVVVSTSTVGGGRLVSTSSPSVVDIFASNLVKGVKALFDQGTSTTWTTTIANITRLGGTTSNGFVKTISGNGTLSIDTNTYLTANQTITLSGDITGSGTTGITTTLATVNSNTGSWGSSTAIPNFTVNAKGLITAAGTNAVIAPAGTLTGTTLAANVLSSSLTSLGTIASLTATNATITGLNATRSTTTNATTTGDFFATRSVTGSATTTNLAVTGSATTSFTGHVVSPCFSNSLGGPCLTGAGGGGGSVTSVNVTVPTGLSVTGVPITTSGTAAISLTAGYVIPTTASTTEWASAYSSSTVLSATAPITYTKSTGVIACNTASGSQAGCLSSANWTTFNNKVDAVSGTFNRINVTGSTNPTVDISASYVGQTSITTLGTITTGVWNGTAIANANLANSTISGISLGSNLANLTATDSTLTFSGTYNGSTARTIGLNLGNANIWTAKQTFDNSSTTNATISGQLTATNITATGTLSVSGQTTLGNASSSAITSLSAYFSSLLRIPNSASPTLSTVGDFAIKTSPATSTGAVYHDGTATRYLNNTYERTFTIATGTLAAFNGANATSSIPMGVALRGQEFLEIGCMASTTGAGNVAWGKASGAKMNVTPFSTSTTPTITTLSSNNTYARGEVRYANVFSDTDTTISCTVLMRDTN